MLAIPSYAFTYCADNWSAGTPVGSTEGTAITLGNSDSKGSTTDLLGGTLTADCYEVVVSIHGTTSSGVDTSALVDIMYDPAGGTSWNVLIPDLLAGFMNSAAPGVAPGFYRFPLYVPRGSSLGARGQTTRTTGTNTARIIITLRGGPTVPGFWFGTKVTAVGVDTANSAGLDHTVGSTGAYSTWTSIGGTGNPAFRFITSGVQGASATHNTAGTNQIRYGFGDTKLPGCEFRFGVTSTERIDMGHPFDAGNYCDIPAGTQLQISGTSADATTETFSVALYGVS